jgi:hypothetical protein
MWKENELKGKGMVYNTPFRKMSTENPNWWSRDALEGFMPWQSPYISMDANPINLIDPLGLKTTKTKDNPGNEPDEYMTDEVAVTAERTGEKKKEPRETPISLPQKADDSDGSSRSASLGQAISNGSVSDEDMTAIANHWINNHTQDVTVKPTMLYPRQPGIDYNPIGTNPFVDGFIYPSLAFTTKVGIMFATGGIGNMFLPDMYGEDAAFKPVEMVYDIASLKFIFVGGIKYMVRESGEVLAQHGDELVEITDDAVKEAVMKLIAKKADDAANILKPLGLGSTGRTVANNLTEQLAMKEIMSNPSAGRTLIKKMKDASGRWNGWSKMSNKTAHGVEIHYNALWENGVIKAIDDFKFIGN